MIWTCSYCQRPIADCDQGILIADDDLRNWRIVHKITCDNDKGPWHPLEQFVGKRGVRMFRRMRQQGAFNSLAPGAIDALYMSVVRENYDEKRVQRTKFRDWLRKQEKRDDPIGDLAVDMAHDAHQTLPNPSLSDLYGYLHSRGACSAALDALIEAYREWQSYGNTYRETRDQRNHAPQPRLPYQPSGWLKLRFAVLKRDGYRCQICGRSAQDGIKLEVDHKVARAKGGTDVPANLWTLCFDCNRGKSDENL